MYPSMLSRAPDIETEPYYCLPVSAQSTVPWSQPTSPTPASRGFTGLLSPSHNASHRLTYPKKNDEGNLNCDATRFCCDDNEGNTHLAHGSQISLMSGGSSMYGSTTEEQRQANEVRRLKRELGDARDQVMSLSSQLSTNVRKSFIIFKVNEQVCSDFCAMLNPKPLSATPFSNDSISLLSNFQSTNLHRLPNKGQERCGQHDCRVIELMMNCECRLTTCQMPSEPFVLMIGGFHKRVFVNVA